MNNKLQRRNAINFERKFIGTKGVGIFYSERRGFFLTKIQNGQMMKGIQSGYCEWMKHEWYLYCYWEILTV